MANRIKRFCMFFVLMIFTLIILFDKTSRTTEEERRSRGFRKLPADSGEVKTVKFIQNSCHSEGCAGLGDRLKGIFSAYAIALLSNRTFLIDMPYPCPLESLLGPNEVDWVSSDEKLQNIGKQIW